MIFLIAGASHTGKTILAQKLLEKYHYPYLSIDHLKMGLIRSGHTSLTPESDDRLLTDYLWPIVREMVKTAIENNQNLIVEGCYIPFDWAKSFGEHTSGRILTTSGGTPVPSKTGWTMRDVRWSPCSGITGRRCAGVGRSGRNCC